MDGMEHDSVAMDDAAPGAVESVRWQGGFWAPIATQFQGAYSDNILRNLLLSMIVGMGLARSERETFVSIVTFLFSLPFLLFSMPGGWLADRYRLFMSRQWSQPPHRGSIAVPSWVRCRPFFQGFTPSNART
jgi:MFS family permease